MKLGFNCMKCCFVAGALKLFFHNQLKIQHIYLGSCRLPILKMSRNDFNYHCSYLNQENAKELDKCLMSEAYGFTLTQLMELAGLSVAQCIYEVYPPSKFNRIVVVCGPGNNGGDGLVAARHLGNFGYAINVLYPIKGSNPYYTALLQQLRSQSIDIVDNLGDVDLKAFDLIVDAVFGFNFTGQIRAPYYNIIQAMKDSNVPIISIDVPSGWNVDSNSLNLDKHEEYIKPECLISLSVPKICSMGVKFKYHFLGGRFVNKKLQEKFNITLPRYPGSAQYMLLN